MASCLSRHSFHFQKSFLQPKMPLPKIPRLEKFCFCMDVHTGVKYFSLGLCILWVIYALASNSSVTTVIFNDTSIFFPESSVGKIADLVHFRYYHSDILFRIWHLVSHLVCLQHYRLWYGYLCYE